MMRQLGATIQNHLLNISGKSISKKVIVFESDDWGSVRIPSLSAYENLTKHGINLSKNPYNRFDSLETPDDLEAIFKVLLSYKDYKGNHPIITTNFIMANPYFEKIQRNNYNEYFLETFVETYKRNRHTYSSELLVRQGIANRLIYPQFHGREHVNIPYWLKLLKQNNATLLKAFEQGIYSVDITSNINKRDNLLAALDFYSIEDKEFAENHIVEGLDLFEKIFGYRSLSFIATCNVWNDHVEKVLSRSGVTTIQSLRGQKIPTSSGYLTKFLTTGQKSPSDQIYLVRNVYYEPSTNPSYDWIKNAILKIEAAFFWNKPAIISSHRLNFIGSLSENNRRDNLKMLDALLNKILKKWPDVEFMTTNQLAALYQ